MNCAGWYELHCIDWYEDFNNAKFGIGNLRENLAKKVSVQIILHP